MTWLAKPTNALQGASQQAIHDLKHDVANLTHAYHRGVVIACLKRLGDAPVIPDEDR